MCIAMYTNIYPAFYYIFKFVLVLWMALPQFRYVINLDFHGLRVCVISLTYD